MRLLFKALFCICLSLALSFIANDSYAQNKVKKSPSIGPKIGYNLAKMGATDSTMKFRGGLNFGLLFDVPIRDKATISTELIYSGKGTKNKESESKVRAHYFEVPVFVKYYLTNSLVAKPYLLGGAALGVSMGGNYKFDDYSESISGDLTSLDAGLVIGAGFYGNMLYSRSLYIDVRYTHGFPNVAKEEFVFQSKARNRVISLNIAMTFPFRNTDVSCPAFWEKNNNELFDEGGMPIGGSIKKDKNTGLLKKKRGKQQKANKKKIIIM